MTDDSAESTRDLTTPIYAGLSKPPQLLPGDVLGDRFVIVRFLARGGNGEVYEAEDRELQGKHIAVKTLRAERVSNTKLRQQIINEVLIAREVSHPNVCPTYDIFRMDSSRGPVVFITMKLLRGESLSARLRRVGRLSSEDTFLLAKQMADALDAAHNFGVVHRDFKPGNVMLTRSGRDVHISITDFGLSRLYGADVSLAESQVVSGTPGYIAPELYEGRPASPASDVYSFGVVLREMLTGEQPERIPGSGFPSRKSMDDVPAAWSEVIWGCLKLDPADRFQSAGEALLRLKDQNMQSRITQRSFGLSRRTAIGLGSAGIALATWLGWPLIDSVLHPLPETRFVALLAWPDEPALETRAILNNVLDAIAVALIRAESVFKRLLVIRPSDVARQITMDPQQTVSLLGANLVLAASLQSLENRVMLGLRILEAASGRVLRQKQISAPSSEASQLPERASIVAAALLQVPVKGTGNVGQAIEHVSPAAYQDFAVAEELRQQPNDTKLDEAIAHYRRALDLDSNFALGYARIAMSYIRKFQITHEPAALRLAERNSDRALQLAPDLAQSRLSRALVDLYSGKTQVAMEAMSRAQRADPANTEILMYEARAFEDLGEPVQEEAKFRSVLQQRPNFWPAYNQLGRVLYRQGRVPDALKAFQDASTVAPHVALPLANAGSMYLRLKRKDDAIEMFQKSLRAAPNEIAYLNLGGMAFEDRDYAKALDYYDKARDLNPRNHLTFRNIADCYDAMGKPSLTKENYARAADLMAEELKTNSRQGGAWMRLAFYDAKAGRQDRVDAELQAAQERGADDVVSQFLKAQTMAVIGRKEEAVQLVLACLTRGLSPVDVELALDLKEVRADSRYRKRIGK